MTADLLIECINNPSRLFQLSPTELRSLAVQYPYAQNLHLLAWEKSLQEDKRDAGKLLEKAAAYSPDRKLLLKKWLSHNQKETPEPGWLLNEDEVLELKALSTLIPHAEPSQPPVEKEHILAHTFELSPESRQPPTGFMPIESSKEDDDLSLDALIPAVSDLYQSNEKNDVALPAYNLESVALDAAAIADITGKADINLPPPATLQESASTDTEAEEIAPIEAIPTAEPPAMELTPTLPTAETEAQTTPLPDHPPVSPAPAASPRPMGKEHFASWRSRQTPQEAKVPKTDTLPANTEIEAAVIAKKSVAENDHLATETLADLLARQGQNEKAIKMYERLSLKFPEKSAYFAAKIEQLKNT